MPKRPPPVQAKEESRFLTVVHPYPAHANMELEDARKNFTYWIAACIGQENILAFFHKPLSRNMIIIEIPRKYPEPHKLLGGHLWSDFLQCPTLEEAKNVSRVFYCRYSTGWEVQKYGWKRVSVKEAWFKSRRPQDNVFKFPYPETHFCELPSEDQTSYSLCRDLPSNRFPKPPPSPAPPVGSAEWTESKAVPVATPVPIHHTAGDWSDGSSPPSDADRGPTNASEFAHAASLPLPNQSNSPAPPGTLRFPPGLNLYYASSYGSASPCTSDFGLPVLEGGGRNSSAATSVDGENTDWPNSPVDADVGTNVPPAQEKIERVMESLTIEGSAPANSESDWGVCEGAGTGDYTGEPITQPSKGPSLVMVHDSLWPEEDNSETKQEEFRCTVHHERGRCSKGICNEYKAFLKKNKLKGGVVEKERSPADRGPWRSRGQSRDSAASGVSFGNHPGNVRRTGRPGGNANDNVRAKPLHLGLGAENSSTSPSPSPSPSEPTPPTKCSAPKAPSTAGTVRDKSRTVNGSEAKRAQNVTSVTGSAKGDVASGSGWGNVCNSGVTSKQAADDTRSVAASSASGWGSINDPWPTVGKKSWADEVEETMDDCRSVTSGGWGDAVPDPW